MANSLQVQFEKIIDWFAMQLGDEEKKRLVTIFHLPKKYYDAYPIIVFQGLKMTGVFGFENLEGLLDIADLLDRKDLFESTKPKLQELKRQKKLRKASTLIDFNMLYSAVDIGPAFEIALKQIEVAQASSELLHKICKYRFKQENEKKTILSDRLKEVIKRLNEAIDLLTLMGEEAIGTNHDEAAIEPRNITLVKEPVVPILIDDVSDDDNAHEYLGLPRPASKPQVHIYEDLHHPAAFQRQDNKKMATATIPKVTVESDSSSNKPNPPPKTLPKPKPVNQTAATGVKHQLQHKPVIVKLDKEGYALPAKLKAHPTTSPHLSENSGSGDSGIGEWPGLFKGTKSKGETEQKMSYQKLLTNSDKPVVGRPPYEAVQGSRPSSPMTSSPMTASPKLIKSKLFHNKK